MPRSLTAPFRYSLERQETGEALIVFVTITHPELPSAIRVANDAVDYVWNGDTYIGFPFDISLISDGDQPPSARLTVQNVDRRIGEAVRDLTSPPRLRIDLLAASDFDETANPRVPKNLAIYGTPLTEAIVGADYEWFGTISGGVKPYTPSIQNPAPGMQIEMSDENTYRVFGPLTEAGTFENIIIQVTADQPAPVAEYTAASLFLSNVRGDAFLDGEIVGWNYLQEVWPGIRATQNRLPGLYR